MNGLVCYCCGKEVKDRFALVALKDGADRVFVMDVEHAKRSQDHAEIIIVKVEP